LKSSARSEIRTCRLLRYAVRAAPKQRSASESLHHQYFVPQHVQMATFFISSSTVSTPRPLTSPTLSVTGLLLFSLLSSSVETRLSFEDGKSLLPSLFAVVGVGTSTSFSFLGGIVICCDVSRGEGVGASTSFSGFWFAVLLLTSPYGKRLRRFLLNARKRASNRGSGATSTRTGESLR